ncbi:MAG: alpha/beta hydrolase [Oceanospirillaceae bacterium]|nr:alpha/beta hydrolase [Oceanospirillaceae bacterium]MBT14036.1 alpha/beta hydrolase [Oceanospirillaceae bacterium]|tara:strand:+ start:72540 stop:73178 length:639 start_codon:yes stop_codon:yes gene_type:complete
MNKKYTQNGPDSGPLFIFAHGAGAPADSEFMTTMAELLAQRGICVVRFNFPYMEMNKNDGKRRPPNRLPALLDDYQALVNLLGRPCVVGGKSMGGRVASVFMQRADADAGSPFIKGCACLGYPFHPPGKPENLRTEHLQQLKHPLLIAQGTRDALGSQEEVKGYSLDSAIEFLWLEDGNHDLKPRVKSGFTQAQHLQTTADAVAEFIHRCLA